MNPGTGRPWGVRSWSEARRVGRRRIADLCDAWPMSVIGYAPLPGPSPRSLTGEDRQDGAPPLVSLPLLGESVTLQSVGVARFSQRYVAGPPAEPGRISSGRGSTWGTGTANPPKKCLVSRRRGSAAACAEV